MIENVVSNSWSNLSHLPDPPSWNPDGLDGADKNLSHEDKEESHEVEGAVCPKDGQWERTADRW